MNRCRQVSTTIISASPPYSGPGLGAKITSRAWAVIGPGTPLRRATTSRAIRKPRATRAAAAHRITRGARRAADPLPPGPVRGAFRADIGINGLTVLLDVFLQHMH